MKINNIVSSAFWDFSTLLIHPASLTKHLQFPSHGLVIWILLSLSHMISCKNRLNFLKLSELLLPSYNSLQNPSYFLSSFAENGLYRVILYRRTQKYLGIKNTGGFLRVNQTISPSTLDLSILIGRSSPEYPARFFSHCAWRSLVVSHRNIQINTIFSLQF